MPERKRLFDALDQGLLHPWTGPQASVAAVLRRSAEGTEALFIERAIRDDDPWSGHMAFPGGRREVHDQDSRATAERETREEIGLDLDGVERLGDLSPVHGGARSTREPLQVSPHAYWWDGPRPELTLNYEVRSTVWVRLDHLADAGNHIAYQYPAYPDETWPGIEVEGGRVVWGLTLRMLEDLFERLGSPLDIRR